MAEILHFEILRKHGQTNTHTNTQTNTQTDMGITIPRPPPMGGEVKINTYSKGTIITTCSTPHGIKGRDDDFVSHIEHIGYDLIDKL